MTTDRNREQADREVSSGSSPAGGVYGDSEGKIQSITFQTQQKATNAKQALLRVPSSLKCIRLDKLTQHLVTLQELDTLLVGK